MATATEERVNGILRKMASLDAARDLFAELNYDQARDRLSRHQWGEAARGALAEDPMVIAAHGDFQVVYCRLAKDQLARTDQRHVVSRLLQQHPYALFLFSTSDQSRWHFLNVKYDEDTGRRRLFRRITVGPGEQLRTATERIAKLDVESIEPGAGRVAPLTIQTGHDEAFDVERVTKEFFREYRRVFEEVEGNIQGIADAEQRRLFTQKLFNRLMFIAFVQKKGWLRYGGQTEYLTALWAARKDGGPPKANFYRDRLKPFFFVGLNTPREAKHEAMQALVGDVPYLNGGLFEEDDDDRDARIVVPDKCIEAILCDLFARFNFTVAESTPLDIEVAVDPEMLGKVFEELVTSRHETGSYYTPKPVVSFMCCEALKGYLGTRLPKEQAKAIAQFVDEHSPAGLRDAEAVLDALRDVTVCDPACGSGAYLLGMLHELLALRTCLFETKKLDAPSAYQRKLEIIENNVYGVDSDLFAVNIARLRLWLSLAVEFEGDIPPPLPNLDFKIEVGDSLTAPSPGGGGNQGLRGEVLRHYREAKAGYMTAHGGEKGALRERIGELRHAIESFTRMTGAAEGFDWAVEFAEVLALGGFDIVVANPPYVRMELFKGIKPMLRRNFPHVHAERADLYVYFYARAHELLRQGGVGCFISSNKWLRAGYGEKLRQHLLDSQAFHLVVDFGELPVFGAATFPAIFLWQKRPRGAGATRWAVVRDLDGCYAEGVLAHVARLALSLPASQFGKGKPRLVAPSAVDQRAKMEASGPRLHELVKGRICRGVVTGLNKAFVLNRDTRDALLAEDGHTAAVVKPLLTGDNARHYEIHFRDTYLLYLPHGTDIRPYPAVQRHLRRFRGALEGRATQQEWYELQQPQAAYVPFFERPKIIYPVIGKGPRFSMDMVGFYVNDKAFFLPSDDWYLLGVLNSASAFDYLRRTCSVLGDEMKGGRLEFRALYMQQLPIPDASAEQRSAVSRLSQQAQQLHTRRRERVEQFLRDLGSSPAGSTSRNQLERPWKLTASQFVRRVEDAAPRVFRDARDETAILTEEIQEVEREIDERVAELYGVALPEEGRRAEG